MTHGTRSGYKSGCRAVCCRRANAEYQAARRRLLAHGKQPLGALVDAATTRKLVKGMLIEGFTFAEMARRLGIKCQRFRLVTDKVTLRKFLEVRRLYRQHVADASEAN